MTINLSDNTPRVSYAVAQGVTQTSFTVSFEFFADADLNVYVDNVLKTITTHYTVSGGSGSTGTVTMSVTGATGGSTVVITRDIALERTTDFPASGAFQIGSLNTELDKITAQFADRKDAVDRSLRLQDSDAAGSMELPLKATRAGTVLGFNATTGVPEAGPKIADVSTLSAVTADIATLADIEDGTTATDAISGLAAIKANVTTVAGIASNVTSVAGNASNINSAVSNASNINSAVSNASNINAAVSNASNINAAVSNASNINAASGHATTATTKASEAATSASNASTSASTSSTQATNSANSATASATSATASATSATASASSATASANSATASANSAAAAASAYDTFDDRYLGSKTSDPSTDNDGNALVTGALYFNSSANEMRVYDGANWIAASSAGTASLILYEYTATSNQTTFSGSDDNSATLSYSVGNIQVVMNGVILDPSDFTATSGTSVVLASGAATGDLLNIYAFKSFTVSDTVSASSGGTFAADVAFTANANFGDNDKAQFGAGSDLQIYHDGSNSYISDQGTGHLQLLAAEFRLNNSANSENMITAAPDGAVTLFHNDSAKIATTSTGATVTGDLGIGTASPSSYNSGADDLVLATTGSTGITIASGTSNNGSLFFADGTSGADQYRGYIQYEQNNNAMAFGTNSAERMRIDSDGVILNGKTSSAFGNVGQEFHQDGTALFTRSLPNGDSAGVAYFRRNTSDGNILLFYKEGSNIGSIGSNENTDLYIVGGDTGLLFNDSSDFVSACTATGAGRDNAVDLGVSNVRFDDIFATNGTIQTSDQNEKQQIASLTTAEITAAKAISALFKTFKWNDKVEAKGDDARTHTGVIAQEVQTAMSNAGLDAANYAFWCSDTWTDDDGNSQTRMGVRYPELLAFVGAATEQRLANIESRLTALEAE
jgi:hypothetical protein